MALIKCVDCEKEISDKAPACIHCGCPIEILKPEPEPEIIPITQQYAHITYREYIGINNEGLIIDGDDIHTSEGVFISYYCSFSDLKDVRHGKLDNGIFAVGILSHNQGNTPHIVRFDNEELGVELYHLLMERKELYKSRAVESYSLYAHITSKKYKGISGGSFTIDGDYIHGDMGWLAKYTTTFGDLAEVNLKENGNGKYSVSLLTTTPGDVPHEVIFDNEDIARELYGLLMERKSLASLNQPNSPEIVYVRDDNEVRCPKCGSTSLSADKKGFGIGKAILGAALVGGVGLAAGAIGSKKVVVTCLKCGKRFKAGRGA